MCTSSLFCHTHPLLSWDTAALPRPRIAGGREQSSFLEEVKLSAAWSRVTACLSCLLEDVEWWLGLKSGCIIYLYTVSFVRFIF